MKQLSIEEKAKAYDEAIERAKGVIEQNPLMEYIKKGIEYIFPELKESEDEKIRKDIIILVKDWWDRVAKNNISTKEQILDCNTTLQRTFELGKQEMKQQMMAKAVDIEVKIDAGGYPYIPQMELYDYDKDEPLAKEGDKYKVVLIKEE